MKTGDQPFHNAYTRVSYSFFIVGRRMRSAREATQFRYVSAFIYRNLIPHTSYLLGGLLRRTRDPCLYGDTDTAV